MATLLKKTTTVLQKTDGFPDGSVVFEQLDEENMPRPIKSVFLPKDLVEDLGNPDIITITITPGDTLNKE